MQRIYHNFEPKEFFFELIDSKYSSYLTRLGISSKDYVEIYFYRRKPFETTFLKKFFDDYSQNKVPKFMEILIDLHEINSTIFEEILNLQDNFHRNFISNICFNVEDKIKLSPLMDDFFDYFKVNDFDTLTNLLLQKDNCGNLFIHNILRNDRTGEGISAAFEILKSLSFINVNLVYDIISVKDNEGNSFLHAIAVNNSQEKAPEIIVEIIKILCIDKTFIDSTMIRNKKNETFMYAYNFHHLKKHNLVNAINNFWSCLSSNKAQIDESVLKSFLDEKYSSVDVICSTDFV